MLKRIWKLITRTFVIWGDANAARMAAALAFYAMLSLAPMLMIATAIAGYLYDDKLVASEIIKQVELITTPDIAQTVAGLIERATLPKTGLVAGAISICVLVFAASGVFTQLNDTFNDIWQVSFEGIHGFLFTLRIRLLGIGMVLIVGIMLVAALVFESVMTYVNGLVEGYPQMVTWLNLADRSLSFLLMPIIFSLMF